MSNSDLRHLELRQLRYFIAVAEEMHFGKAALRLNMTQPPLSQAIQSLETLLGTALFIRTTRHTALTPAGIALLPEARRLLEQANSLRQLAQSRRWCTRAFVSRLRLRRRLQHTAADVESVPSKSSRRQHRVA
jgi:DNA-binding transcriptional LysR family regulator